MGQFRLLHLSDLHFCRRPNNPDLLALFRANPLSAARVLIFDERINRLASYQPQLADAIAEFVYHERDGLDAVVITGDLATTGINIDLQPAERYVAEPCSSKWLTSRQTSSLASAGLPIFVLPGNHDRYLDDVGRSGGTEFDRTFAIQWPTGARVHTRRLRSPDDAEKLGIVLVDFCLRRDADAKRPTRMNRYGRGRVYPSIVRELVSATRGLYDEGITAVVWATHFPPSPVYEDEEEDDCMRLLESDALIAAAQECEIRHLLAGHIHRNHRYEIGDLEVFCAATSTAVSEYPNEIHVLSIWVEGGRVSAVNRQDHPYNLERQSFA